MKMFKILTTAFLLTLLLNFTSCSDDDNNSSKGDEKEVLISAMKSTIGNFTYNTSYEYDDNNQLITYYYQRIHTSDDPDDYKMKYSVGERVDNSVTVTEYKYDLTSKDWVKGYITYKLNYNSDNKIVLAERFISGVKRDVAFSLKWDGNKIVETAVVEGSIISFNKKMEYDANGNFIYLGSTESDEIVRNYEDENLGTIDIRRVLKQIFESGFTSDKNYYSLLPVEAVVVQHLRLRENIPFSHYCSSNAINKLSTSHIDNMYFLENENEEEGLYEEDNTTVISYATQLGSQSNVYPAGLTITDQNDYKFVNHKRPSQSTTTSKTEVETIDFTYIEKK